MLAEVGESLDTISLDLGALSIAFGEEQRRAAHLLSRRNSPEGFAGAGSEGYISIPGADPGSPRAVRQIRALLVSREGVA